MITLQENQIIFYQTFKDTPKLKAGKYVFILDAEYRAEDKQMLALAHESGAVNIREASQAEKEIWFYMTNTYPNQSFVKMPEESEYPLLLATIRKDQTPKFYR